jgi:hypothetical protein
LQGYLQAYAFPAQIKIRRKKDQYVNGSFHTNSIENFWSLLKRGIIGIFHQVSAKHLQRYCDEFASRYNTRQIKDHERFEFVVSHSDGRLKYADLIADKSKHRDEPFAGQKESWIENNQ